MSWTCTIVSMKRVFNCWVYTFLICHVTVFHKDSCNIFKENYDDIKQSVTHTQKKKPTTSFKLPTFDTIVWEVHKMQAQSCIKLSPFPSIASLFFRVWKIICTHLWRGFWQWTEPERASPPPLKQFSFWEMCYQLLWPTFNLSSLQGREDSGQLSKALSEITYEWFQVAVQ